MHDSRVLKFCYLHKACDPSGFQLALNGHRCLTSIPVIRYDAAVLATGLELFGGRLPSSPSTQSRHSSVGPAGRLRDKGSHPMTYITTHDGTRIFYKDWGSETLSRSCSTMAGH